MKTSLHCRYIVQQTTSKDYYKDFYFAKLFFKIPSQFKIDTPIGTYNPDWAVYVEKDGEGKLYFVLETKGTENESNIRPTEKLKIHCGRQHFKALGNGTRFDLTWIRISTNLQFNR